MNHFASWLSGFTDGEGYFGFCYEKKIFVARFAIRLREDDREILEQIRDYFKCGYLYYEHHGKNPSLGFCVNTVKDNRNVIISHFDRYPLLAKKKEDYKLWREAVMLMWEIHQRPFNHIRDCNNRLIGHESKYTHEEWLKLQMVAQELKEQRQYKKC